MFYAKSTGGFYETAINGKEMPLDSVEISSEKWKELLDGQSEGMQIGANESGFPVLFAMPQLVTEQQPEQTPMV